MANDWLIYGAYGYTGELVAREAISRGLRPVLAGRSEAKLKALSAELGLQYRAFDCDQIMTNLAGIKAVLNCAGPFSSTAEPIVKSCIDQKIHYVDITGEIAVFEMCNSLHHAATSAGVVLCPGAGFDIVPTDCLAALLKKRLPDASSIDLAFSFGSRPSLGTALTTIEGLKKGGVIRQQGHLVNVPNGFRARRIPFTSGSRWAVTIPWGDVYTAGVSTGVPNGMVYSAAPLGVAILMRISNWASGVLAGERAQSFLKSMARRIFSEGPDASRRASSKTEFWGEATNARGERVSARLTAPGVYDLTADTAVDIICHCLLAQANFGYFTPSMLLGENFITDRPNVSLEWLTLYP
ncbi:saccharopine dehydrogenase [Pseudomonas sp. BGM005]|nr:saccharopine dehydrogenase [Pseudomonas sp. BG5]